MRQCGFGFDQMFRNQGGYTNDYNGTLDNKIVLLLSCLGQCSSNEDSVTFSV